MDLSPLSDTDEDDCTETSYERRQRARFAYFELCELKEKYNVVLTRSYSILDDPEEMELEYRIIRERLDRKYQEQRQRQAHTYVALALCLGGYIYDRYGVWDEFLMHDGPSQSSSSSSPAPVTL